SPRAERAGGDAEAGPEQPVPVRGPGDRPGKGPVLAVGRGAGEGDRGAVLEGRAGRRGADGDRRRGVDDDRDGRRGALAAGVRDRGRDDVRAGAEARGDGSPAAEVAVAVGGPVDGRRDDPVVGGAGRGGGGGGR